MKGRHEPRFVDRKRGIIRCLFCVLTVNVALSAEMALAGFGPSNVALVANRNDPDSLAVANAYRQWRRIPDNNVFYVRHKSKIEECTWEEFERDIRRPVLAEIEKRGLSQTISFWVTTLGMPSRIGKNGITGVLLFGKESPPKSSPQLGPAGFTELNPYFESWRALHPSTEATARFGHMMLGATDLQRTLTLIERSASADGTFPSGTYYLLDGDPPRDTRRFTIPLAQRSLQALGAKISRAPKAQLRFATDVRGLFTGVVSLPVEDNVFLPGALADHLTSFGGVLTGAHGQLKCTAFLDAGCSASHGAVLEPYNYPQKFPIANLHVLSALGFSAGEAYLQSLQWPQQSLFVGDPLSRPFAVGPKVRFESPDERSTVSGELEIAVLAEAEKSGPGVVGMRLFLDDRPVAIWSPPMMDAGVRAELHIDGETIDSTSNNAGMPGITQGLVQKLLQKPGYLAIPHPGELVLLRALNTKHRPEISANSEDSRLFARSMRPEFVPGVIMPSNAGWIVRGASRTKDELTLEIQENGKLIAKQTIPLPDTGNARQSVDHLVLQMSKDLPDGYKLRVNKTYGDSATDVNLELVAEPARAALAPRAKFSLQASTGSTLSFTNPNEFVLLVDPTLQGYDVAIVRFGWGLSRAKLRHTLDTTKMPDGLHRLRCVASLGYSCEPESLAECTFVVRNGATRLTVDALGSTTSRISVDSVAVAKIRETVAQPTFFVNGLEVPSNGSNELRLRPRDWGVGQHRITAAGRNADGAEIRSDNALLFQITK